MKRKQKPVPRNAVAYAMIVNGTGKAQTFKAKQDKRAKDYRNSWRADLDANG
jgi:hypothetical protein